MKLKRCQGCDVVYQEKHLARFGRHVKSPMFCKICAEAEFQRLRKNMTDEELKHIDDAQRGIIQ